ncbi:MAG TPA: helix-turn-helix domain-containing protein [Pseudonocardia sp.]|nr:helix-turn-helix domain-containing protein [Pseudonocardia sp.]
MRRWLTTGELAQELSVSRGAVQTWERTGVITPKFTTPGGHHRWDLEDVRRQLAEHRARERQRREQE